MKTRCLLMVFAMVATLVLTACTAKPPATPQRPPLKISWTLWPGEYPLLVAKDLGLFEKHGVSVELLFNPVYSDEMSDIRTGKVDGVTLVQGDMLLSAAERPDSFRVVLVVDNSDGADVVVATPDIVTPADLKGKHIGVKFGTYGELFVRNLLEINHLSLDDVDLVEIQPENVPDKMPDVIQAGQTWEPYRSEALAKGYHDIFTSAQTPGLIADVLTFRAEVVKQRPEDVRAFIAAWYEAVEYWKANTETCVKIVTKYTNLKPEEVSMEGVKLFGQKENQVAFTRGKDLTSLYYSTQIYLDFMTRTGALSRAIDINLLLDPSFIK